MDNQARRLEKHVSQQGVRGNLGANPRNMTVIFNSILRRAFIKLTNKNLMEIHIHGEQFRRRIW